MSLLYADEKEKCKDVDEIRKGISKAVSDSGNEIYFLDLDAHNENIFNKMMTEIVGCKFLIADFTSQNTGVYYEAGYAKVLVKTVIYTCKNSDFGNVHFDIKQTQFVVWNNAEDLAEKLLDQIEKSNLGGCMRMHVLKLRFKADDGTEFPEWKEKNISEILSANKMSIPKPTNGYERLEIRSHGKGTFHEYVPTE